MVTKMLEEVITSVLIVIVKVVLSVQVARVAAVVSATATRAHQVASAKAKSLVSTATDDLARESKVVAIGREDQGIRWVRLRQLEAEISWVRAILVTAKKGAEVAAEGMDHPEKIGGKIEDAKGRVKRD